MADNAETSRLRALFELEQAWWRRQQAWSAVQSEKAGPRRRELWQKWLAACAKTEAKANAAAGDPDGLWREPFYEERRP